MWDCSKRAGAAATVGSIGQEDLVEPVVAFEPRRRAKYQSSFSIFVVGKRKYEFSGGFGLGLGSKLR